MFERIMKRLTRLGFSFLIILLISIPLPKVSLASESFWIEVNPTNYGKQSWDNKNYLSTKNSTIVINTRFTPIRNNQERKDLSILYTMEIDCKQNRYRDLKENGVLLSNKIWKQSNGDKLIEEVISDVCLIQT